MHIEGKKENDNLFNCSNGKLIRVKQVNDLISDCQSNIDEPILYSLLKNNSFNVPNNSPKDQYYCFYGHPHTYKDCTECIYKIDSNGLLETCRNGRHLQNCTHINCNTVGKFKCPGYYCIPMGYVCDGKIDCPNSLDENNCQDRMCSGLFHCLNTSQCIFVSDVCNSVTDCIHGDDEFNCLLNQTICPQSCSCLLFAVQCILSDSFNVTQLRSLRNVIKYVIKLSVSVINLDFMWVFYLQKVQFLHFEHFFLPDICVNLSISLKNHISLFVLDISNNFIVILRSYCFASQTNLLSLNISHNTLTTIEDLTFSNLIKLKMLDLSHNIIISITAKMLSGVESISFLLIKENPLKCTDENV